MAGLLSITSTLFKVCHHTFSVTPYSPLATAGITLLSNNLRITFAVSSIKVTLEVSGSFWMAVTINTRPGIRVQVLEIWTAVTTSVIIPVLSVLLSETDVNAHRTVTLSCPLVT